MQGYIKLHRKCLDSSVFENERAWRVWCWLLLNANWRERELWSGQVLKPGDLVVGLERTSGILGIGKATFSRLLKRFEARGMIVTKVDRKWTTVSICSWRTYQDDEKESGPIVDLQRTDSGPSADRQRTQKKKVNSKEGKQSNYRSKPADLIFDEFWKVYPRKVGKQKARTVWDRAIRDGVDAEQIIAAARVYARAALEKETQFIAHPTTWLAQGRWDDEPEAISGPDPSKPRTILSEADQWERLRSMIARCQQHTITDGRCASCGGSAQQIDKVNKELGREEASPDLSPAGETLARLIQPDDRDDTGTDPRESRVDALSRQSSRGSLLSDRSLSASGRVSANRDTARQADTEHLPTEHFHRSRD